MVLMVSGCAARAYEPPPQLPRDRAPESSVTVTISPTANRGCKKDPNYPVCTLYGRGNDTVTWRIVNNSTVDKKRGS
jgi:hypothetical protein